MQVNIHCLSIYEYNKNIKKCTGKIKSKFRKEGMGGGWNRKEIHSKLYIYYVLSLKLDVII